jgi:taurine--2-oxoglutarate transaminase
VNQGDTERQFADKCLQQIEEVLMYEGAHTVAAFILETVTGTNGIIIPPDGYLQGVRALCDKHGILLICDEVMAGLGRTGEWFACDNWKVVPDLITMAKGVTSAYMPLGAIAISEKIASFYAKNVFYGGLTYSAHPMCLAAAVANLRVLHEDDLVGNSKRMGVVMGKLLADLKAKVRRAVSQYYATHLSLQHPCVGDVRNIGLFGCIELVKNRKTKEVMGPYVGADPHVAKMNAYVKDHGVYAFQWKNFLHTNPPLCVTESELKEVFGILDNALYITDEAVTKN